MRRTIIFDFLVPYLLWIKALHIISVVSWLAGLLYLPRLFVYHCEVDLESEMSETFKIMELKLLRFIMNPAMIVTLLSGVLLSLGWPDYLMGSFWLPVKIVCVLGLMISHMAMAKWRKDFENNANIHNSKVFRIINEVPTLLMIFIIILVVVQPF